MLTDTNSILAQLIHSSHQARKNTAESGELICRSFLSRLLLGMKAHSVTALAHSQRVAIIASGMAQLLGWNEEQRRQIEIAAVVHETGKLSIPSHIISKPGKLTSEEYDHTQVHLHAGINLLQIFRTDPAIITMLNSLQRELSGETASEDIAEIATELPLGTRILAVADAYDSLTNDQPWRRARNHSESVRILLEASPADYDEHIVRTLDRWHGHGGESLRNAAGRFEKGTPADMNAERKQDLNQLAASIRWLADLQQLYDGYLILDATEHYCLWSDGMPGLTGLPAHQTLYRSWLSSDVMLTPPEQEEALTTEHDDTIIAEVLRTGQPQVGSYLCRFSGTRHLKVETYTAPIFDNEREILGVIQMLSNKAGVRLRSRDFVELKLAATRDALTGVANRGQLETQLRTMLEECHASEGSRQLSVIFLDVDHFKRINDNYGHQVGDQVLVDLARLLQNETYSAELIGRYGGEEFVLLCPDTDLESAVRRAERLRLTIMKSAVGGVSTLSVTSSLGVALAQRSDTVKSLLDRADSCLYKAKASGRNRTRSENELETGEDSDSSGRNTQQLTKHNGQFFYHDRFEVSTSLELTALKLRAFIAEHTGTIIDQKQGWIKMSVGSAGFFGHWGRVPERQPVDLVIEFETSGSSTKSAHSEKVRVTRTINVEIHSQGRVPGTDEFEGRCRSLIRDLRAFLLTS